MFGCLIFLNFIIAEVSDSYVRIRTNIKALIYKERAKMVKEVEDFYSESFKLNHTDMFPQYVVVRETEADIEDEAEEKEEK